MAAVRRTRRREAVEVPFVATSAATLLPSLPLASAATERSTLPLGDLTLGTCCLEGEASAKQVAAGLAAGYRWLDTASHYNNETDVAEGIRRSGFARSDVNIITKIWFDDMGEGAAGAIKDSLQRLRTDYIDLFLIHFPGSIDAVQSPATNRRLRQQTWKALEEAKAAGVVREIGVANFCKRHLKELLGFCKVPPAVNQMEIHPYFQNQELVDYCVAQNVQPMAFSPLAHGELRLLEDATILKVAAAHKLTPAQVVLRWLLDRDIPPVMFSSSAERLCENLGALDASRKLSQGEVERICALERRRGRVGFDPNLIV